MECPNCKERMSNTNATGYPVSSCLYCNGVWVGGSEIKILLSIEKDVPSIDKLKREYERYPVVSDNRKCPACENHSLNVVTVNEVELDLCTNCFGVFFDEGEIKSILPNTHESDSHFGMKEYCASEGLFWILFALFSR